MALNEDTSITNDTNFLNTAGVTLGNEAADNLTFAGGLGSVGGATTAAGTIATTNTNMDFAALTLTNDAATTLSTGGGGVGNITITGALDGEGVDFTENLTLTAGTGSIDFQGAVGGMVKLDDVLINSALNVDVKSSFEADSLTQAAGTGTTTLGNSAALSGDITINGGGGGDAVNITTDIIDIYTNLTATNGDIRFTTGNNEDISVYTANLVGVGSGPGNVVHRSVTVSSGDLYLTMAGSGNAMLEDARDGTGTAANPDNGLSARLVANAVTANKSILSDQDLGSTNAANSLDDATIPQQVFNTASLTYSGDVHLGSDSPLTAGNSLNDAAMVSSSGTTSLSITTTGGDIVLDRAATFGALNLILSTDRVIVDNTGGTAFISTGDLTMTSGGVIGEGDVTSTGGGNNSDNTLTIDVANLVINATGGNNVDLTGVGTSDTNYTVATGGAGMVTLTQTASNLVVVDIDSTGGVTLDAVAGNINDGAALAEVINATGLRMNAQTGIVTLNTQVAQLAAETEEGNLQVVNVGSLDITTVDSLSGVIITDTGATDGGEDILITTSSPLTISQAVSNNDGGDIILAAEGSAGADDLTVIGAVTTTGGTGKVELYAGGSVIFNATGSASAAGAGTVLLSAGQDYNGGGALTNGNNAGAITMTNGATAQSEDGDITLRAPGSIQLSSVNANSNADGTAGDITLTADFDGVGTGLSNNAGAITEVLALEPANLTGNLATVSAATGIGTGDNINTDLVQLNATNSFSGNIIMEEVAGTGDNALELTGAGNALDEGIDIQTVDGDLTVSGAVATSGNGTITLVAGDSGGNNNGDLAIQNTVDAATGKITLTSNRNDVTFTVTGDVTTTTGEIEINAGALGVGLVTMADGTVLQNTSTGTIDINGEGNVTLGRLVTTNTALAVNILSNAGDILQAGDAGGRDIVTGAGGRATLNAAGAITGIETDVAELDVDTTAAGNVTIDELNAVGVLSTIINDGFFTLTANGTVTATSITSTTSNDVNDVNITATAGDIDVVFIATGALGDVTLDSQAGAVNGSGGGTHITTDDLTVYAETGIGSGTALSISGVDSLDVDTTAGNIDIDNAATASVTVVSMTTANAGGTIDYDQSGNQALDLQTVSTTDGNVTIGNTGGVNADIQLGTITADTGDDTVGITSAGAITDDVDDVAVDVTAANINLIAAGGGIGQVANGSIDVNAVVRLDADTDAGDDASIAIDDVTGDLPLGAVTAGAGAVVLNATAASSSITDANAGVNNVTAGDLTLTAPTNIGTITDFAASTGDAIEITLGAGNVTSVAITDAGDINLDLGASTPTFTVNAFAVSGANAGEIIVQSTGNLDASAASFSNAFDVTANDSVGLRSGATLTIPDAGLAFGAVSVTNLLLSGATDVVDTDRTLVLGATSLSFTSGSAGGDTTLSTDVTNLKASIITNSANLVVNENDATTTNGITLDGVSTFDGTITVTATTGDITDTDATAPGNSNGASFTTSQASDDIDLDQLAVTGGTLTLNTTGSGANATIVNTQGIDFAASNVGGMLTTTATLGNLTQTGGLLTVDEGAAFTTSQNDADITLNDANNAISGTVTFSTATGGGNTGNVVIDNGTTALVLGASTINGSLTATSGNVVGITDSAQVTVANGASFTTDASSGVVNMGTLDLTGGTLALATDVGGNATVVNTGAVDLAASAVQGDLSLTANGAITDAAVISVTGSTSLAAGVANNITLNNDNDFTGAVSVATGNDATLADANSLALGVITINGALQATADSDSGSIATLSVNGDVSATTITLSGGAGGTNDTIDINANVTASGLLTIQNANSATGVDLAAGVQLSGAGVAINSNVSQITLSGGAGTAHNITSTGEGSALALASVSGAGNENLTLVTDDSMTIANINIGTGTLLATVDDNDDSNETLTVGLAAGLTFDLPTSLLSGGGTGTNDTLAGPNQANIWNITGSGDLNGIGFDNFDNLTGNVNTDTFNFSNGIGVNGTVDGLGNTDTLDFATYTVGIDVTLTGIGAGASDFNGTVNSGGLKATFQNIEVITGSGNTDSISNGYAANATWVVNGVANQFQDTDTVGHNLDLGASFRNMTGGAGVDTFDVTGDHTGTLSGGAGDDVFNLSVLDTVVTGNLIGGDGADDFVFSDDARIVGSLHGDGAALPVTGSEGVDSIDFSASTLGENVTITGNDARGDLGTILGFAPSADLVSGGFTGIDAMSGNSLGTLVGPDGQSNAWIIFDVGTIAGSDNQGTLNGSEFNNFALLGGDGQDTFEFQTLGIITADIDGGPGTNIVTGDSTGARIGAWTLTGPRAGTVDADTGDGKAATNFSNIDNLVGGIGDDTFTPNDTVNWGGSIDGSQGSDTIDWLGWSSVRSVAITASGANGFNGTEAGIAGGFMNMDTILAPAGQTNTLRGEDAPNTWAVTTADDGTLTTGGNVLTYNNFDNLAGGSDTDAFDIDNPIVVSGFLDGNGGIDTLNLAAYASGRNVVITGSDADGFDGTEASVAGNFADIDVISVPAAAVPTNTLQGQNATNTWVVNGADDGTLTTGGNQLTFNDFDNLSGGTGADSFTLGGGTLSGEIAGGGGTGVNSLTGDDVNNTWVVTAAGTGTLTGTGGFSDIHNLTGGSLVDSFSLGAEVSSIDGAGGGADTLNVTAVFAMPGALTITAVETLDDTGGGNTITATGISIAGATGGIGGTNPLSTSIGTLQVTGSGGTASFVETSGVDLLTIDMGVGGTFNLDAMAGAVTNTTDQTITAGTLGLDAVDGIGTSDASIVTTAASLNLGGPAHLGFGATNFAGNIYVETSAAITSSNVSLGIAGGPGRAVLESTAAATDITYDSANALGLGADDVLVLGGTQNVNLTGGDVTSGGADIVFFDPVNVNGTRTFNMSLGDLFLEGGVTGTGASFTVNAGETFLGGGGVAAAKVAFNSSLRVINGGVVALETNALTFGGNVRSDGVTALRIVPVGAGAGAVGGVSDMDIGGAGETIMTAANVGFLNGFDHNLRIGGDETTGVDAGIRGASNITVSQALDITGDLSIVAAQDLTINADLTATGGLITLVALGEGAVAGGGSIANGVVGGTIKGADSIMVARNAIGEDGNEIVVDVPGNLDFKFGADEAFIMKAAGGAIGTVETDGVDTTAVAAAFGLLGIDSGQVTNVVQTISQVFEELFGAEVDESLFEEFDLMEVEGMNEPWYSKEEIVDWTEEDWQGFYGDLLESLMRKGQREGMSNEEVDELFKRMKEEIEGWRETLVGFNGWGGSPSYALLQHVGSEWPEGGLGVDDSWWHLAGKQPPVRYR
ncbi:MAG: S-layer family protein [Gammaproteobacteria bacterium]|nr:S-layer family protein [Gammaproteobacteria bacterium]